MRAERLDSFGIITSSICAIHCFAGAIFAAVLGVGGWLLDERLELAFAVVAIVMAVVSLGSGARRHRSGTPLAAGLVGIAAIGVARVAEFEAGWLETALSIGGAAALVTGHLLNLRALRCRHCIETSGSARYVTSGHARTSGPAEPS
jgi:hypothetical protein